MKEMKKIFASIIALAALVSCSDFDSTTGVNTRFTAPMEVTISDSRVFDADLNWLWEDTDVIAAYQNAGEKTVNQLTRNGEGNFFNDAFVYATTERTAFHFVYPASQLGADYSLTAVQTGLWTPVLYGTVEGSTVKDLGVVEMNYLSSAFELRVWESDKQTRKSIVKAVLASESDFVPVWSVNSDLTYTQGVSGKELSLDLNGDTAIFNLGQGEYTFAITLTDADGDTHTVNVTKDFVVGKRTILNIAWKAPEVPASASVDTWYEDYGENGSSALDGGCIYVTAEGGEPVVTVDGNPATVTDGKVSVASGVHAVIVTINGKELVNRNVTVTTIPTINATIRTSYSNNGKEDKTNDIDGRLLTVTASLSDSFVNSNLISSSKVYNNGTELANLTNGSWSNTSATLGQYNCYVKIQLQNGYICTSPTYTTHVTGIPYSFQFYQSSDTALTNAGWTLNGASIKMELLTLKEGGFAGSDDGWAASPAYHIPAAFNTTITLAAKYYCAAIRPSSQSATIYVGATSSATTTASATSAISLAGTNNTSSNEAWTTATASVSMPKGSQHISINHNDATYYLGSRIYVATYDINYQ